MILPFHVVIPSRFGATRLPGKPLRLIAGVPMIEHVHRRALAAGALSVTVATDDERIRRAVEGFGGVAVMTAPEHASGTDRLAEVARREGWPSDAIVVNLQGDEPCMDPAAIAAVAALLGPPVGAAPREPVAGDPVERDPAVGAPARGDIATLATPLRAPEELFSPDVVKVIVGDDGLARWFTRAPVPWVRGQFDVASGPPATLPEGVPFLRHLGLYAYRVGVLLRLCSAPVHPHERAESLEQLRGLAMGYAIRVGVLDDAPGQGVDTEADLARAEVILAAAGRAFSA